MKSSNPPVIEVLKKHGVPLNGIDLLKLPTNSVFGNLSLSYLEIILRVEWANNLIERLHENYELVLNNFDQSFSSEPLVFFEHKMIIEQIISCLRKTADELISLSWLLDELKSNSHPDKIKISCIGDLLKTPTVFGKGIEKHCKILKEINEISNAFKHSFINSQFHSIYNPETPTVFSYYLKYNNLKNKPSIYQISLESVLIDFSNFLKEMKNYLKDNHCEKTKTTANNA